MHDLNRLRNHVREKGYPELKDVSIGVYEDNLKDAALECFPNRHIHRYGNFVSGYSVCVDPTMMDASEVALIGGLAHEFSHIIKFIERGCNSFAHFVNQKLYRNIKRYKRHEERQTDADAIKRGFGDNLIELHNFLRSTYPQPRKIYRYNLANEEIENLMQSQDYQ